MKKSFILAVLALTFIVSACSRIDPVPVYTETEKSCTKKTNVPVTPCTNETRVINYAEKCNCSDDFPVTIRKVSDCSKGDLI